MKKTRNYTFSLPIVAVFCLTTLKPGRKVYPVETLLSPNECGLPQPSIAMAHQIRAIVKERLAEVCGAINKEKTRGKVRKAIKQLSLRSYLASVICLIGVMKRPLLQLFAVQ